MMRDFFISIVLVTALATAVGCVSHADQRCASDAECRSNRVCSSEGRCVDPTPDSLADAGNATDAVEIEEPDALPPAPDLVVEPSQLDFPVPDGSARQRIEWELLTLRNAGELPLRLDSVAVIDSESFVLRYPDGELDEADAPSDEGRRPPDAIAPGGRVPVRVWYSTEDSRSENATLEIRSNDPDEPVAGVPLVANANPPCLEIEQGSRLVFDVEDGVTRQRLTLRNCGSRVDLTISDIRLEQDGGGALELFGADPAMEFPVTLEPNGSYPVQVDVTTDEDDWNRGVIVIESNDPYRPRRTVDVLRNSPGNDCPVANVDVYRRGSDTPISNLRLIEPGTIVELDGSNSADPDGEVVEYRWRLLESPGAGASFSPSDSVARPTLDLSEPGNYVVELDVVDDQGAIDCAAPGQVRIVATRNDIQVEIQWRTPGDPDPSDNVGSNVDLHYLHPNGRWNERPWDIWEAHPTADWSRIQRPDTPPEMQVITRNGPGREVLYHATPEWDLEFSVGVFYVDDRGFGPSFATVRLITDDQVVWESREVELAEPGQFYEAARFAMPGPEILEIDETSEGFPLR